MQKTYKVNTLWSLVAGLDSSNRNWQPTTNRFSKICRISWSFHAKTSFSRSWAISRNSIDFKLPWLLVSPKAHLQPRPGPWSRQAPNLRRQSRSRAVPGRRTWPRRHRPCILGNSWGKNHGISVQNRKYMWNIYQNLDQTNKPKHFEFWVLLNGSWQANQLEFQVGQKRSEAVVIPGKKKTTWITPKENHWYSSAGAFRPFRLSNECSLHLSLSVATSWIWLTREAPVKLDLHCRVNQMSP